MKRHQRLWLVSAILAIFVLIVSGCSGEPNLSTLAPKGSAAKISFDLMMLSIYIMLGVMAVVSIIYVYVLIRFRKRKNQTGIPKQTEGSTLLEIIWTSIPIILLVILAIPTVISTFALAKDYSDDPEAIKVKVTAHQYWWEFQYPDQNIVTAQELYIPVGKKVALELTSEDVIHSFWVPSLMGKTDTNPGYNAKEGKQNVNHAWLDADEPGVYEGRCTELCGAGHALMNFKVVALPQDEFDAWVSKMTAGAPAPTSESAKAGEEIFNQNCLGCHAVNGTTKSPYPNLAGIGDRQTIAGVLGAENDEERKESLAKWISNPQKVKPGNNMPAFGDRFTQEQIDSLVEYLSTLKVTE